MKITVQVLSAILLIATFSLVSSAMAWATTTREVLYIFIFLITSLGLILSFLTEKAGIWILLFSSFLWLLNFAIEFGWFITFELDNLALWAVIFLPIVICISIASISVRYLLPDSKHFKYYKSGALIIGLLIPISGLASYANHTYDKSVFTEFYDVESEVYKIVFRAGPADTRKFEVEIGSDEIRTIVLNSATFVANHHYLGNTKLSVRMSFSTIEEIQLNELSNEELDAPLSWKPDEVNGTIEFLKY
jgi:hypothetical protein